LCIFISATTATLDGTSSGTVITNQQQQFTRPAPPNPSSSHGSMKCFVSWFGYYWMYNTVEVSVVKGTAIPTHQQQFTGPAPDATYLIIIMCYNQESCWLGYYLM
jgi:hypothetical protein